MSKLMREVTARFIQHQPLPRDPAFNGFLDVTVTSKDLAYQKVSKFRVDVNLGAYVSVHAGENSTEDAIKEVTDLLTDLVFGEFRRDLLKLRLLVLKDPLAAKQLLDEIMERMYSTD